MMNRNYKTWTVWRFPVRLKNKFVGKVKEQGSTVPIILEYLINRWLREERQKEERMGVLRCDEDHGR